jgi:aldehyde:ferredoxin oxidoreductase
MSAFGYMGKILYVDLSSQEFEIKDLDLDAARDYLGGLGLNAWLMEGTTKENLEPAKALRQRILQKAFDGKLVRHGFNDELAEKLQPGKKNRK